MLSHAITGRKALTFSGVDHQRLKSSRACRSSEWVVNF